MSYLGRSAKLSLKAQEKVSFLATAGQTSKTGLSYTPTFVEVYVNGVLLTDTTDFTATNGNSVTFTVALLLNDEVTVVSLKTFALADHYNKVESDAQFSTPSDVATSVTAAVSALVDTAPATLDTLNELAAALGDDPNFATTVTNSIATKAPIASPSFTGTVTADGLIVDGDGQFSGTVPRMTLYETDLADTNAQFLLQTRELRLGSVTDSGASFTDRLKVNMSTGDISFYEDTGTTAKFFWDASAESLGIGTSASNAKLEVAAASGEVFRADSAGGAYRLVVNQTGVNMNGNVLVGTTNSLVEASSTEEGVAIFPNKIGIARTDGPTANFNRMSSDGAVVQFRKDGSVVGSIGTAGGDIYLGNGTKSLMVSGNNLLPRNGTGGQSSGTVALGSTNNSFSNLYLTADAFVSGGVYLGGTGAANKLDDYESGTWTPSGTNLNPQGGRYTKVGNLVTCTCRYSASGGSVSANLTGLPFASVATTSYESAGGGVVTWQNAESAAWSVRVTSSSTVFHMYKGSASAVLTVGKTAFLTFSYIAA